MRRRLAEQGYVPTRKTNKNDPGPALRKRRVDFAKAHEGKTPAQWRQELQAVGDFKEFTWYPKDLRPQVSAAARELDLHEAQREVQA